MAEDIVRRRRVRVRFACLRTRVSESCYYYRLKLSSQKAVIVEWLLRLTTAHRRWEFGLCYLHLRNVRGISCNHKRVYQIYRELDLNLRIKPRLRLQLQRDKPDLLGVPTKVSQVWSIDFMSETVIDGRKMRTFNVIDDYNREGLCIDVDLSLSSARVVRSLAQIIEWCGKPAAIRLDNGPEYVAQNLIDWANERRITFLYIQPGKPTQNAYIKRLNRTVRHEWLDLHRFNSISHAQELATQWLWKYNNERSHTGIGGIPHRRLLMAP